MPQIATERLAEIFVELADTLVHDFGVVDFLETVATRTSSLVSASAAGVLLADHQGRLQLMAATSAESRTLELFAAQSTEGPCQDCFRQGAPVISVDLRSAGGRWPTFAPLAVVAGFRSVHAFPLRLRQEVIGVLNLFSEDTGDLSDEDACIVQALADVTTIGLLQHRAVLDQSILTEQLQTALNTRITIEQAKGALAQIHGCTPDEAFTLLRAWCRRNHQRLSDVAYGVTTDPTRYPELTTAQATG